MATMLPYKDWLMDKMIAHGVGQVFDVEFDEVKTLYANAFMLGHMEDEGTFKNAITLPKLTQKAKDYLDKENGDNTN